MLSNAKKGAVFLLASPYGADEVWDHMPDEVEQQIIDKKIKFYVIDAIKLATSWAGRPHQHDHADLLLQDLRRPAAGRGDRGPQEGHQEDLRPQGRGRRQDELQGRGRRRGRAAGGQGPAKAAGKSRCRRPFRPTPPSSCRTSPPRSCAEGRRCRSARCRTTAPGRPARRSTRSATSPSRSRSGTPELCIQCGSARWSARTPPSASRPTTRSCWKPSAPATFKSADAKGKEFAGLKFTVQVAPEDCTGCGACVQRCPGREKDKATKQETGRKAINMTRRSRCARRGENFEFFLASPRPTRSCSTAPPSRAASCRRCSSSPAPAPAAARRPTSSCSPSSSATAMIANATGCSSIYGGNLPTTPYCRARRRPRPGLVQLAVRGQRRVRLGMRLAVDKFNAYARELLEKLIAGDCTCGREGPAAAIKGADQSTQDGASRSSAPAWRAQGKLAACDCAVCKQLLSVADYLVKKSSGSRRRRLGLRHRLRRPGPRAGLRPQRQCAGAGHRGVLQHRRPGLQVHADGRGGQVRRRRQADDEEGPGHDRHDLRQHLRGQVAMGANPARRSRPSPRPSVRRPVADHRLLALHRARHRHDHGLDNQKDAVNSGHFPLYRYNPSCGAGQEPAARSTARRRP
jgi:pyruvate-ferredoxin/flavodoxin oxidoreductase